MRLLVVNWQDRTNPQAGGAEIYLTEIFRRLAARHETTLFCSSFPGAPASERLDGLQIRRAGTRLTFNVICARRLPGLVAEIRPDLVIDDINKIPFYSPWLVRTPVLALVMHLFQGAIFREVAFPFASYVYLAERLIPAAYRDCWFGVLSASTRRDLEAMGLESCRMKVIPPGVDLKRYQPAAPPAGSPLVVHVGRLKRYKSTDQLLQACARLAGRGVRFDVAIVGDGDDRPRLERLTRALGLADRVRFTGFVTEEEKIAYYRRAQLLVETSAKEGWGMIVIEANACGTPVIAARTPGLVDSVRDGESGLFYEYGDIAGLADRIGRLLADPGQRAALARQGIAWARQFTWDHAAAAMEELIEETLGVSRKPLDEGRRDVRR